MAKIVGKNIGDIPGTLKDYGGGSVPTYYLLCDGSVVSQTTYAALFAAIGSSFNTGGEGAGNFRLPDSRRRTLVGSGGTGTGTLGNAVGNTGGEETHPLTTPELASHSHGVSDPTHVHDTGSVSNVQLTGPGGFVVRVQNPVNPIATAAASTGVTVQSAGSGTAHNNIQPSLIVTKIIKT